MSGVQIFFFLHSVLHCFIWALLGIYSIWATGSPVCRHLIILIESFCSESLGTAPFGLCYCSCSCFAGFGYFVLRKIKVERCYHLYLWRSLVSLHHFKQYLCILRVFILKTYSLFHTFELAGDDLHADCSQPPPHPVSRYWFPVRVELPVCPGNKPIIFQSQTVLFLSQSGGVTGLPRVSCPVCDHPTTPPTHPLVRRFWIMDKSG